eukprot:TRINITY_DN20206_c0_g1_i1.p1 TRINITY_DN20206_c0_g1~~TRINITY_DN20206_c0_g1_i1.p1  ORF type:complete len:309 (+),score=49.68 TRINITY_DN20206_c0_g1_i1:431-1357(+)
MSCSSGPTSCGSRSGPCCEADLSKCAAWSDCTGWCGRYQYCDPGKAANTITWHVYGNDGDFVLKCCSPKPTCNSTAYSCPAGFKRKQHTESQLCPSDAESCATSCCEAEATKCASQPRIACGMGKFLDPRKAGFEVASDPLGNCCSDTALCKDALAIQVVTLTAQTGSGTGSDPSKLTAQTGSDHSNLAVKTDSETGSDPANLTAHTGSDPSRVAQAGQGLPVPNGPAFQTRWEVLLPWLLWGITLCILCLALCFLFRQRQQLMASRSMKSVEGDSLPERVIGRPVTENSMAEKPASGLPQEAGALEV